MTSAQGNRPAVIQLLFLAASPPDMIRVSIGEEQQAMQKELAGSPIEFIARPAVRRNDLADLALDNRGPVMIHFSGHCNIDGSLVLADDDARGGSTRSMDGLLWTI
ncbi:MAG: hypothetical protein MJE77_23110 [Proteobacteria bacterium]|nr:hypothetical protein [Pseudomonadota bacterium]